jgi:hypothetical protein
MPKGDIVGISFRKRMCLSLMERTTTMTLRKLMARTSEENNNEDTQKSAEEEIRPQPLD